VGERERKKVLGENEVDQNHGFVFQHFHSLQWKRQDLLSSRDAEHIKAQINAFNTFTESIFLFFYIS